MGAGVNRRGKYLLHVCYRKRIGEHRRFSHREHKPVYITCSTQSLAILNRNSLPLGLHRNNGLLVCKQIRRFAYIFPLVLETYYYWCFVLVFHGHSRLVRDSLCIFQKHMELVTDLKCKYLLDGSDSIGSTTFIARKWHNRQKLTNKIIHQD